MKKTLRGFSFVEVLLYLGLFSLLSTGLFTFAWDVVELSRKGQTERLLTEEARFALERVKYVVRSASGIDAENSVFDTADGKLVVDVFDSSDDVTIERQNNRIVMQVTGQDPVALQSEDTEVTTLLFQRHLADDGLISSVDMTATFETLPGLPDEYSGTLTLRTGMTLRNLGL